MSFKYWFIFMLLCFNFSISSAYFPSNKPEINNHYNSNLFLNTSHSYQFIWEELANASKALPGDDIIHFGESFGPYHNYSEITTKLFSMNQSFPTFIDVFSIGTTYYGKEIWCVKITNESISHTKQEYLFVAQHHAREQITVENCLYCIDKIIQNVLDGNREYLSGIQEKEYYFIPSLNIDGASVIHRFTYQRKTLRPLDEDGDGLGDELINGNLIFEAKDVNNDSLIESYYFWDENLDFSMLLGYEGMDFDSDGSIGEDLPGGVDPNRNYDYDFGNPDFSSENKTAQDYRGESAFSEKCTQVLRDFVLKRNFLISLSFHSGIQEIYYPDIENHKGYPGLKVDMKDYFFQTLNQFSDKIGYKAYPSTEAAGMFSPWIYYTQDYVKFAICLETYGNQKALRFVQDPYNKYHYTSWGIWDMFNPPGDKIIENSQLIFKGIDWLLLLSDIPAGSKFSWLNISSYETYILFIISFISIVFIVSTTDTFHYCKLYPTDKKNLKNI